MESVESVYGKSSRPTGHHQNVPSRAATKSSTILTTEANALLKDFHDRVPVILKPDDYDLRLGPGVTDSERVADLLRAFDAQLMRVYPVSPAVNKVENDGPECAEESREAPNETAQSSLF